MRGKASLYFLPPSTTLRRGLGQGLGQAPTIRTQALAHTFTNLPGERYTFRVTATDNAGNAAEATASFVYQGDPPQVSVSAQAQDADVVVTWSASDAGAGLDTCTLEVQKDGGA